MSTAPLLALIIAATPASPDSGATAEPRAMKVELQLSASPLPKGATKQQVLRKKGKSVYERAPEPSPLVAEKDAEGRLKLSHGPRARSKSTPAEGAGRE